MGRKLAATVVIGEVSYLAGSTPPDDVAEQITNPAAWGEDEAKAEEPAKVAPLADAYIGAEDEAPAPKPERPRPSRRSQS